MSKSNLLLNATMKTFSNDVVGTYLLRRIICVIPAIHIHYQCCLRTLLISPKFTWICHLSGWWYDKMTYKLDIQYTALPYIPSLVPWCIPLHPCTDIQHRGHRIHMSDNHQPQSCIRIHRCLRIALGNKKWVNGRRFERAVERESNGRRMRVPWSRGACCLQRLRTCKEKVI